MNAQVRRIGGALMIAISATLLVFLRPSLAGNPPSLEAILPGFVVTVVVFYWRWPTLSDAYSIWKRNRSE